MTFIDHLFGRKKQFDLTAQLASMRLRNEARAKAQKELLQAEGKYLLNPAFEWISADKFSQMNGL